MERMPSMQPLSGIFYTREPSVVARELVGKRLLRLLLGFELVGTIVETEAYGGRDDPASHASIGMTDRNRSMFGHPGKAYVYFTYGNHYCFNVVTRASSEAGAVLIRAINPIKGMKIMAKNRGISETDIEKMARGPGNLTKALSITRALDGHDLTSKSELYITEGKSFADEVIASSQRIGLKKEGLEKLWRFYAKGDPCVSRA